MKLAALALVLSSSFASSLALGCPDMDHAETPRTADKAKETPKKDNNGQPKADQKPAEKAGDKTAKPTPKDDKATQKPADKVSIK
jgi:hypothetical protein